METAGKDKAAKMRTATPETECEKQMTATEHSPIRRDREDTAFRQMLAFRAPIRESLAQFHSRTLQSGKERIAPNS